ncbi:chitooligosaccharidolytic beta-N-acetylglucosaminidase-like [Microplitis mediator]|uniref:chitooligosaccharidolytic beta-N-acetylglucosaminidase-like n=1 Tax=Microplitis mediator TaxID=375433 RepID=UPI002552F0C4|nr:chitooligosaccharidolytic beta-N-acetylglucosaminidase-like [Microplitis mediator]
MDRIKFYLYRRSRSQFKSRWVIITTIIFTVMFGILITVLALQSYCTEAQLFSSPWHYKCVGGYCKKEEITPNVTSPLSLEVCQLFCGQGGALWPKPTGHLSLGNFVAHLNPDNIQIRSVNPKSNVGNLLYRNVEKLKKNVKKASGSSARSGGLNLSINIKGLKNYDDFILTLNTRENYTLQIYQQSIDEISVTISGDNYFGVRHGIETLSQLIVYNDLINEIQVVRDVYIVDGPVYPYRGILLDTSRNYMDKASILRTIEAMGMSKLNTFHWHITDSHSFPYVSRTWPNMSRYGAYTPSKVYTAHDIKEIVEFGFLNGVRVLPEFDAPAHVGEGWQWVGDNATVCFRAEPWSKYCVEPPCGQLNPASERVYEILEGIYKDMMYDFKPDIFHMGGDEVNINCWNSSEPIRKWMMETKGWDLSESSFIDLWGIFQERAYEKLKLANGGKDIPVILWTSGLTNEENLKRLDPNKYIIQIWTTGLDLTINRLIKNDFKVIFSNYDALYLDCGFGAWVGEGANWCSPYKGWQKVYENSPLQIIRSQGFESKKHLILGGEAALWSEQVDSTSVDARLWPRSAAMAERLWAEPQSYWMHAEQRMLRHRERLVKRGIFADSLEPEWCLQNQGHCYL